MSRSRSNAILADSVEEYLASLEPEEETEENDEAELVFAERTGSITRCTFSLQCCSDEKPQFDECVKILLLGASGVGKTQFLNSYLGKKYTKKSTPTNGVDINTTYVHIGSKIVKQ
jgi:GTP-binding protein EngB required for normal cell division